MRTLLLLTILGTSLYAGECNNATVKGIYGYTITGTTPVGQVIGVGARRYDGEGGFTQVDTVIGGITGTTVDFPASGTYTINPDCTGTMRLTGSGGVAELRLVVIKNGKEIRWIVLNPPGATVTGNAVRQ